MTVARLLIRKWGDGLGVVGQVDEAQPNDAALTPKNAVEMWRWVREREEKTALGINSVIQSMLRMGKDSRFLYCLILDWILSQVPDEH